MDPEQVEQGESPCGIAVLEMETCTNAGAAHFAAPYDAAAQDERVPQGGRQDLDAHPGTDSQRPPHFHARTAEAQIDETDRLRNLAGWAAERGGKFDLAPAMGSKVAVL